MKANKDHNCMECDIISCMDFFSKSKKLEGGELYVLETTINNRLHLPCELGMIIRSLCKMLTSFTNTLSFELFYQCVRDLRSASFLILTGHYRNAKQIMRPIIENWLVGLYWDFKISESSESERNDVIIEYERFTSQEKYEIQEQDWIIAYKGRNSTRKRFFSHDFVLHWLVNNNMIESSFKSELQEKIGILNRCLHPNFKSTEISNPDCAICPAEVTFDEGEYQNSVEIFQDISAYLFDTFCFYIDNSSPEKADAPSFTEGIDMIISLIESEEDVGRQIIHSNELRNFIIENRNEKSG